MKNSFRNCSHRFLNAFALLLLFSLQAQGRVYVVTDTRDTIKVTSLRGAIMDANSHGGNNTIILGQQRRQQIYRLTLSGADEDAARKGDLDITRGNLIISGAVSKTTIIDATGLGDRVFQVFPHANLTLANLTITGGTAPQAQSGSFYTPTKGAESGGAIYNAGGLMLKDCVITNNSSGGGNSNPGNGGGRPGGDGGAIFNSAELTMINCSVAGNFCGGGVDGASGGNGGGIYNVGTSALSECHIGGNASGDGGPPGGNAFGFAGSGGDGGGVYNTGSMILINCTVGDNLGGQGKNGGAPGIVSIGNIPGAPGGDGGNGAGIYNSGQLKLTFCTINNNTAGSGGSGGGSEGFKDGAGGAGGSGAGIYNAGSLSLNTCTISMNNNGIGGDGGKGYPYGGDGGAGGSGAGVHNTGAISINSCTISENICGMGGNGGAGYDSFQGAGQGGNGDQGGGGGGICNVNGNISGSLGNSLIALNLTGQGGAGGVATSLGVAGLDGSGMDLAGDFTSQGFNLIGAADGSTDFTNDVNADQVGSIASPIDPLIGPLQMNGGLTPTHALLPGSPAIDQGKSFGVHTDQRGYHRPYNYTAIPNAPGGDGSDIGAFEMGAH